MKGQVAFEAIGGLSDGLILEAAEVLGFLNESTPAALPRKRERGALTRFFRTGWGVALLCAVVSLTVLGGIVWAGQRPTVTPPVGTNIPATDTESEPESTDELISEAEALAIASDYWGIRNGDRNPDNGFEYRIESAGIQTAPRGESVYVVLLRWFVDGHHWSTVDVIWVDCVTGEVIIPYGESETETHVHAFGDWRTITEPTCSAKGTKERVCDCGERETESVATLPHTEVIVPGVEPTVSESGYSEGKECEVCGKVLSPRSVLPATGHTDLAYEVNEDGKTCTITGIGTCTATDIYIPSKIEGYKVTRVGMIAFLQNTDITGVHIPTSITEIGEGAFSGCTGLTEITLPSSITLLDYGVFMNCTGLKTAVIQCRITELPPMTFEGCTSLTSVTLPNGLEQIRMGAFSKCVSLERIDLPASLWNVGVGAFQGCTALKEVKLPSRLSYLEDMAFEGCAALTAINLPDSLLRIGANALSGCNGIAALTVPGGVKQAEPTAFEQMEGLTDIYFKGSEAEWNTVGYKVGDGVRVHFDA